LTQCLRHICEGGLVWRAIWDTNAVGSGRPMVQGGSMQLQRRLAGLTCCNARPSDEHALVDCCLMESREAPRGIFHAAGVLDDRLFVNQTPAALRYVFGPKAVPCQLIDLHSVSVELTSHLYASSVASVFGGMGQANYAAANAYMNSLADKRSAHG
jgi:hypothetical protein